MFQFYLQAWSFSYHIFISPPGMHAFHYSADNRPNYCGNNKEIHSTDMYTSIRAET